MSDALSGSFADNLSLPVHRWFRYSAGFSGDWARSVIADHLEEHSRVRVLDPFCGSGTVMIAADSLDAPSVGLDAHPFVSKIANVKSRWAQSAGLTEAASALLSAAKRKKPRKIRPPDLLVRCYDPQALERLLALRASLEDTLNSHDSVVRDLLWLAITSILRKSARVGTAQWQYLLPKKTKAAAGDPFDLFARQIDIMRDDIDAMTAAGAKARSAVLEGGDARSCPSVKTASVSLVLTSPPYPNNYDYADAVRLEMTFWGEVETWGDLHQSVRKRLMVSSSQHASKEKIALEDTLALPVLQPVRQELANICRRLDKERVMRRGHKHYHTMVAAYFRDMGLVWQELRRMCRGGSSVCFVIGDSAPYGVYVPAPSLLSELAEAAGFSAPRFEKIRDRNIKWKNRKHRVPLQEGRLWLKG